MDQIDSSGRPARQAGTIERVQVGARMEKNMVKVLKALAEYLDLSLGDLIEGIVLHAFEHKQPFGEETLKRIAQLREVYGMTYGAEDSHRFVEQQPSEREPS
jgi:hypothetical protein